MHAQITNPNTNTIKAQVRSRARRRHQIARMSLTHARTHHVLVCNLRKRDQRTRAVRGEHIYQPLHLLRGRVVGHVIEKPGPEAIGRGWGGHGEMTRDLNPFCRLASRNHLVNVIGDGSRVVHSILVARRRQRAHARFTRVQSGRARTSRYTQYARCVAYICQCITAPSHQKDASGGRDCLLDVSERSSLQRASDTILRTNGEQCDISSIFHVN